AAMREHGIEPIDMVVVNLYPFQQTITRENVTEAEAIEQIDIGGPAMIRSSAKNAESVTVVVRPESYPELLTEMRENSGSISLTTRKTLARMAFTQTAMYDAMIASYLAGAFPQKSSRSSVPGIGTGGGGSSYNEI